MFVFFCIELGVHDIVAKFTVCNVQCSGCSCTVPWCRISHHGEPPNPGGHEACVARMCEHAMKHMWTCYVALCVALHCVNVCCIPSSVSTGGKSDNHNQDTPKVLVWEQSFLTPGGSVNCIAQYLVGCARPPSQIGTIFSDYKGVHTIAYPPPGGGYSQWVLLYCVVVVIVGCIDRWGFVLFATMRNELSERDQELSERDQELSEMRKTQQLVWNQFQPHSREYLPLVSFCDPHISLQMTEVIAVAKENIQELKDTILELHSDIFLFPKWFDVTHLNLDIYFFWFKPLIGTS